jgi:transcriptional regulator with XRE-family HTH domain
MFSKEQVGARLKSVRKKCRLTQAQVAEYLGIDQSLVSKIEEGERAASSAMLNKLAALFCCPVTVLAGAEGEQAAMRVAFRAEGLQSEDLQSLAFINKIALNQAQMEKLWERKNHA